MSEKTGIEWADSTWSPWRGCTKVSTGCAHCYAETLSKRNTAVFGQWGKGKPRVINKNWRNPAKWNRAAAEKSCGFCSFEEADGELLKQCHRCAVRPRVFPSLCDWLDEEVPIEWLARFMQLIHDTPNLDWLLLTKRPENWEKRIIAASLNMRRENESGAVYWREWAHGHAPSNVWVGTSVEDQQNADRRIPQLLKIPARLRFLSVEPMLGPVDLDGSRGSNNGMGLCWDWTGNPIHVPHCDYAAVGKAPPNGPSIDWVIVGGESGHGARPCDIGWIRDIVRKCATAGVPCFVKQLGAKPFAVRNNAFTDHGFADKIMHPKGGDPDEWPEDLRVRQMPEVKP